MVKYVECRNCGFLIGMVCSKRGVLLSEEDIRAPIDCSFYEHKKKKSSLSYIMDEINQSPNFKVGPVEIEWGKYGKTKSKVRVKLLWISPYKGPCGVRGLIKVLDGVTELGTFDIHNTTRESFWSKWFEFETPFGEKQLKIKVTVS